MAIDPQALQDRLDIRHCVEAYSDAVTMRDWVRLATVFHPDAEWKCDPPINRLITGRENIVETLRTSLATYEVLVQCANSVIIHLDGDKATARVVIAEWARKVGGASGMDMRGVYEDRLVRFEGRWVCTHRHFRPILLSTAPPPGDIFWQAP